jgi:hypothetical protein
LNRNDCRNRRRPKPKLPRKPHSIRAHLRSKYLRKPVLERHCGSSKRQSSKSRKKKKRRKDSKPLRRGTYRFRRKLVSVKPSGF